jgi:hypothetical protein
MEKDDLLFFHLLKEFEDKIKLINSEIIDCPNNYKDIKLQKDCDEMIKYVDKIISERIVFEGQNKKIDVNFKIKKIENQ